VTENRRSKFKIPPVADRYGEMLVGGSTEVGKDRRRTTAPRNTLLALDHHPLLVLDSPSTRPHVVCRPRPRRSCIAPTPGARSKHILNAQVSIRAPCCRLWFDCPQCHADTQDHELSKTTDMTFICKKCKKAFRKDMSAYEDSDEYCPHCDNHYVIDAKTPAPIVSIEGDDIRMDARCVLSVLYASFMLMKNRMLKDERVQEDPSRTIAGMDTTGRLG
jgi:uncharacterized CHY-type Zn-finger protein